MSNNHSPTNSDYNLYFLSQREQNSESMRPDNVPYVVRDPGFTIDDRPRSLRKETMPGDFSSFQNLRRKIQLSAAVLLPWHESAQFMSSRLQECWKFLHERMCTYYTIMS
jgi:hypothetical protein